MSTTNNNNITNNDASKELVIGVTTTESSEIGVTQIKLDDIFTANEKMTPRSARNRINLAGFDATSLNDTQALIIASTRTQLKDVDDKTRSISLKLGALSSMNLMTGMVAPNGKTINSEDAFFKAFYPEWSNSTLHNYTAVGRVVYLPVATNKNAHPAIKLLATQSPSNLQYVIKSLTDKDAKPKLLAAIMEGRKKGDKLTQKTLRAYNKMAQEKDASDNLDAAIDNASENVAQSDFADGSVAKFINDTIESFVSSTDEISYLVKEECETKLETILTRATKEPAIATEFCKAFLAKHKIAIKQLKAEKASRKEITE